jgi:hypothetical protein
MMPTPPSRTNNTPAITLRMRPLPRARNGSRVTSFRGLKDAAPFRDSIASAVSSDGIHPKHAIRALQTKIVHVALRNVSDEYSNSICYEYSTTPAIE